MKKLNLVLIALILCISAYSQRFELPAYYVQRELKAPAAVKTRLTQLRSEITAKNLQFTVGYTSVAEIPIEKIAGAKVATADDQKIALQNLATVTTRVNSQINAISSSALKRIITATTPTYIYGNPTDSKLDLRKAGYVTPVRDQGYWGSCWAFSAMAAYESSYKIIYGQAINASEEYVVNCFNSGGWDGGWPYKVFMWMTIMKRNAADETALPYSGPPQNCPSWTPMSKFYAIKWGMVDAAKFNAVPDVTKIKEALCKYGVISTTLYANDMFKHYTGGYFFGFQSSTNDYAAINHAVAIIGWDDSIGCWLIKNSWGTDWGTECGYNTERGYMWIKYNSNNIGVQSIWVTASDQPL